MKTFALLAAVALSTVLMHAQDQKPEILSLSEVVVGAQKVETQFAHVVGKWSDADPHLAVMSTEITCFERFGFCDEADAAYYDGQPS